MKLKNLFVFFFHHTLEVDRAITKALGKVYTIYNTYDTLSLSILNIIYKIMSHWRHGKISKYVLTGKKDGENKYLVFTTEKKCILVEISGEEKVQTFWTIMPYLAILINL